MIPPAIYLSKQTLTVEALITAAHPNVVICRARGHSQSVGRASAEGSCLHMFMLLIALTYDAAVSSTLAVEQYLPSARGKPPHPR